MYGVVDPRCHMCRGPVFNIAVADGGHVGGVGRRCSVCRELGHIRTHCPQATHEMRAQWAHRRRLAQERAAARNALNLQRHNDNVAARAAAQARARIEEARGAHAALSARQAQARAIGAERARIEDARALAEARTITLDARIEEARAAAEASAARVAAQRMPAPAQHSADNVTTEDIYAQLIEIAEEQSPAELDLFLSAMFD